MKVLCIGYPKTGTKSLHVALKELGYRVYDYEHNFYYLGKQWTKILTREGGTKEDFYRMYKDVDVTMDMPACIFWKEILEAFPDAKLIFNERKTEEEWWVSWNRTAENSGNNKFMRVLAFLSPTAYSILKYSHHVGRVTFGAPPQPFWQCFQGISPNVAKKCYRNHNAYVNANAPKDRMLMFSPSQGWEPLCKFLGKPVPDMEFPHKNKNGSVLDDLLKESPVFKRMKHEMAAILAIIVGVVAIFTFNYFF